MASAAVALYAALSLPHTPPAVLASQLAQALFSPGTPVAPLLPAETSTSKGFPDAQGKHTHPLCLCFPTSQGLQDALCYCPHMQQGTTTAV